MSSTAAARARRSAPIIDLSAGPPVRALIVGTMLTYGLPRWRQVVRVRAFTLYPGRKNQSLGGSFLFDPSLVPPQGRHLWQRITGSSKPVSLLGPPLENPSG